MLLRSIRVLALGCALVLSACGGSNGDDSVAPNSAAIGAAGGTVADPGGAKVSVPPGALAQDVVITVAPSSAGAPPLPVGSTALGPTIAFTPHGMAFAVPATITVPFDATLLAAGEQPALYKTDASLSTWAPVSGATVTGSTMSGAVSGFSYAAVVRPPPPELVGIERSWSIWRLTAGFDTPDLVDSDRHAPAGELSKAVAAGTTVYTGWDLQGDGVATAALYSSADGVTYWARAEAPHPGGVSSAADFDKVLHVAAAVVQKQYFRKVSDSATYDLVITHADVDLYDGGPTGSLGCDRVFLTTGGALLFTDPAAGLRTLSDGVCAGKLDATAVMQVHAEAADGRVFFVGHGGTSVFGTIGQWEMFADPVPDTTALWGPVDVEFKPDFDGDGTQRHARAGLRATRRVRIDLSSIAVGEVFSVQSLAAASAGDTKQLETYASAYMRDPAETGGVSIETTGLAPVSVPAAPSTWGTAAAVPAGCVGQPRGGELSFLRTNVQVDEVTGPQGVSIEVLRAFGSSGAIAVDLVTVEGSAHAGQDYLPLTTTLRWDDGDLRSQRVIVPLIDDPAAEGDKSFGVRLSAPTGCAVLRGSDTATVTIRDHVGGSGSFTLGGTVNGLAGSGLLLDGPFGNLAPTANGPFTMPGTLVDTLPYTVRVLHQPESPAQVCTVTNGSGVVAGANVTNVQVACVTTVPVSGLDTSFGSGGQVAVANPGGVGEALAVQPDGKILVAASGTGNFTLLRLLPDGSLDAGFGSAGIVSTDFGSNDDAYGTALQGDGRIVVVGRVQIAGGYDFGIARYEADGRLDASFGIGGKLNVDFAGGTDYARAVVIQADGKIVVGGQASASGRNVFGLLRLSPDGSLDSGFGSGGKVQTILGTASALAYDLALASDGKLVLAGEALVGTSGQFAAARYAADGNLDTGFGAQGIALVPVQSQASARGVQVLADGSVLLAGGSASGVRNDIVLVKLDALGKLDTSFGGGTGKVTTNLSGGRDSGMALAVQADGRAVVAGYRAAATGDDMAVLRYLADGAADSGFGSAGALVVDHAGGTDRAQALTLQADGRILVSGQGLNGSSTEIVVLRVLP